MSIPAPATTTQMTFDPKSVNQGRWDTFHNDPSNTIIIKSADGTYFRASSYRFCPLSVPLAALASIAIAAGKPIEMPYSASAIRAVLDFVATPPKFTTIFGGASATYDNFELRDLLNFYKRTAMQKKVDDACTIATTIDPLAYLSYAVRKGTFDTVKNALTDIYNRQSPIDVAQFLAILATARPEWRLVLLHAVIHSIPGGVFRAAWPPTSIVQGMKVVNKVEVRRSYECDRSDQAFDFCCDQQYKGKPCDCEWD